MRIGLIIVFMSGMLWLATRIVYDWMIPGIPDAGPYAVAATPVGLSGYVSGERLVGNSLEASLVWLLSIMTFAVPPMFGRFVSRRREQLAGVFTASVLICCFAWLSVAMIPVLESHQVSVTLATGSVFILVVSGWVLGSIGSNVLNRKKMPNKS